MPIIKLFFLLLEDSYLHFFGRLIMQTSIFNRTVFFEYVCMCKKKKKERKRKWCDAFERTQHANEDDDDEQEEEENWVKKFVKCFHHQRAWEWANKLPSSSLFILIRAHIHKRTSRRYTWERNREKRGETEKEREQRHTIILGHDDAIGIFVFASPAKKNRT
jgi:hypothetical protein